VNLSIYDSKQRQPVNFVPQQAGKVSMYVCGPTVQSAPHIGHLRSALVYDQMRRWFETLGLQVTLVRNVTDIDDKILQRAQESDSSERPEQWWALASRVEREFDAAYRAIGITAPTAAPRATGHIGDMVELIARLIERGHAYPADDGSGSVYFDTASWQSYGELTHQSLAEMEDADDGDSRGKRNQQDFALWKGHRESEPDSASWPSPWGAGRPGWHIECSAMATRLLGSEFDIHGGGLDLRFPHHENELAQSHAAGDGFARIWVHNGLVSTGGQKMSKSLGNSLYAEDLLSNAAALTIRYFLGSAHYRSQLEFTPTSLDEAANAVQRIGGALKRAHDELGSGVLPDPVAFSDLARQQESLPEAFIQALNDDFGVPSALAEVHRAVRSVNSLLDAQDISGATTQARALVAMLGVLHIDPRHPDWARGADAELYDTLDVLVSKLIEQRARARKDKDFATGDAIREQLAEAGIRIEDGADGTHWSM
jgi:cysteinyl-tRNA synthetase